MKTKLLRKISFSILLICGIALNSIAQTWQNIGFAGREMHYLAMDKNNKLFVGSLEKAHTTIDGGITWDSLVNQGGANSSYKKIIITDSNYIAFNRGGGSFSGIYLSRQANGTLTQPTVQMMPSNDGFFVNKKHHFFKTIGNNGEYTVMRTANYGISFDTAFSVLNIFTDTDNGLVENKITETMLLYYTTKASGGSLDSSQIYRSIDNGLSWTRTFLDPGVNGFGSVVCDKNGVFYASLRVVPVGCQLLKSTDDGLTWVPTTVSATELTSASFGNLSISSKGTLIWYERGMFNKPYVMHSIDGGTTWVKSMTGLPPNTTFYDIVVDSNDVCFIATGDGIYKSSMLTSVKENNDVVNSLTISPNPSNGKFTLELEETKNGMANEKVEIFNMLGEKVYSEKVLNPKSLTLNLDVPNGIYLVQFKTSNCGIISKKIIINN